MDLSNLSMPDKLSIGGGIGLLVAIFFLPAYSWSIGSMFGVAGTSASWTIWDAGGGIGFLILAGILVGIAAIVLRMLDVFDISDQGVPEATVVLIAAGVAAIFTLYRVASIPGGAGIAGVGRSWGMWIALAAAVVYAVGAFMKFQEER